jgi:hypothetical protein
MNRISRILLLAMLLLGGAVLYNLTSQHVFAASKEKNSQSITQYDPSNYVEGFQDGVKAGYQEGLTTCTIQQIQEGTTPSVVGGDVPPPTPYENGYSQGYASGNQKGVQTCQNQGGGTNPGNNGFPSNPGSGNNGFPSNPGSGNSGFPSNPGPGNSGFPSNPGPGNSGFPSNPGPSYNFY